MNNKSCKNCIHYKKCKDGFTSWTFFIIGLIATISIRIVTFLMRINPTYGKISWYIGVVGFLIFFIYKFKVLRVRSQQIREQNIIAKIDHKEQLTDEDYTLISVILCSISSNKERMNYLFIFVLSAIALFIAIYIDFFQ